VASVENKVILKPGVQEQTLALRIDNVKLWHFDQPSLYRLELELLDSRGNGLDSLSDTFGARTLDLRDRHLYLNGERVRLSGITRHEDSPWEGLAETRGTIKSLSRGQSTTRSTGKSSTTAIATESCSHPRFRSGSSLNSN
jgi:beta-galactosidase/beta-glucuronidase